jgi:hypothetical protein
MSTIPLTGCGQSHFDVVFTGRPNVRNSKNIGILTRPIRQEATFRGSENTLSAAC